MSRRRGKGSRLNDNYDHRRRQQLGSLALQIFAAKRFQEITQCDHDTATEAVFNARQAFEAELPPMRPSVESWEEEMFRVEVLEPEREVWRAEDRRERAERRTEP